MMELESPLVGCAISNRNYSFSLLRATKEGAKGSEAGERDNQARLSLETAI